MERTVFYDPEAGILIVRLKGQVTLKELKLLSHDVLPMVAQHHCLRLLSDVRDVTMIQLSWVDIYAIPRTLVDQFACLGFQPYRVKRAVVVSTWSPVFSFFEDLSNNRMLKSKVFLDLEPAKAWLRSPSCQNN